LGKKDFIMRIRIALKEAKEAAYWLRVIEVKSDLHEAQTGLHNEAVSLVRILCAILHKVSSGTLKERV
jgi:four helix bundle protein